MELIQKTIRYNQEGKKTFDQFYLDEDYNVPDAKQDVRRIIKGQGTVKIWWKIMCGFPESCISRFCM